MAFTWRGAEVRAKVERGALRGVSMCAEDVRNEALSLIQSSPATGRPYTRRGVTHIASSPGSPYRNDTGQTSQKIRTRLMRSALTGIVNFGAAHAADLEYGTSKMEPRPAARPALANRKNTFDDIIAREIRSELR